MPPRGSRSWDDRDVGALAGRSDMSIAQETLKPAAALAVRRLAVATLAGAILGFVVGGVGGRLAMSLLASLNGDVAGVKSDDGFTMGQVTLAGTLNLLLVGTVLGALGGIIFLALRNLRMGPTWFRAASIAGGATVVVGANLVHADGVDFTLLEPTGLTIGVILAIPLVYALALPPLADSWLRDDSALMATTNRLVYVPLVVCVVPLLPVTALLALGWIVAQTIERNSPRDSRLRMALPWLARLALTVVFVFALADLVDEIREIYRIT
jgi:hypothetical protein